MSLSERGRRLFVLTFVFLLSLGCAVQAGQKDKKKKRDVTGATPVLWREPSDIAARNLLLGPGGEAMRPDLSRVSFIKDETGGYSKKYRVRDGAGRIWVAKIGDEAQSETAATRLVWAAGYVTETTYLVPRVEIQGKGTFENVRFEARPEAVERLDEWKWKENPFSGTREFQGLKVLMALLENWDLKDANNRVLLVRDADKGTSELHYIISDLGATYGKTGAPGSPIAWLRNIKGSRNNPEDYAGDKFIAGVEGGNVRLHYGGKNADLMRNVTIAEAKWIGGWLARLSDEQIADAFRAANYSPEEVRMLSEAVRSRINELVGLRDGAAG
ncbi:MAG TPA: hypothetical protein VNA19_08730 [Pyrinomonadaceae bacterium]|jgi:hypothetical protein|nr:hypothetical protein [Pyrinomonadaceae bacterium]